MRKMMVVGFIAITTQLSGCFFVFIPGELIQRVSDGFTGAEGEHCVSRAAKVGDIIRSRSGGSYIVRSLSGATERCRNPETPIRAALDPAQ